MADNIMAIHSGRLSLSRITYNCDLQQAPALVVPLGVMAEITIGQVRALGLIARTRLWEGEIAGIGRLIRPQLLCPFNFLKVEFDWAFSETRPGEALVALSNRFSESLLFETPRQDQWRKVLPTGRAAAEPVLTYLRQRRDDDFYLMLAEMRSEPSIMPSQDMAQLAA